jgi:hypothetical protein
MKCYQHDCKFCRDYICSNISKNISPSGVCKVKKKTMSAKTEELFEILSLNN